LFLITSLLTSGLNYATFCTAMQTVMESPTQMTVWRLATEHFPALPYGANLGLAFERLNVACIKFIEHPTI